MTMISSATTMAQERQTPPPLSPKLSHPFLLLWCCLHHLILLLSQELQGLIQLTTLGSFLQHTTWGLRLDHRENHPHFRRFSWTRPQRLVCTCLCCPCISRCLTVVRIRPMDTRRNSWRYIPSSKNSFALHPSQLAHHKNSKIPTQNVLYNNSSQQPAAGSQISCPNFFRSSSPDLFGCTGAVAGGPVSWDFLRCNVSRPPCWHMVIQRMLVQRLV